jgi:ABC-type glucose/galactose transport system permease subunit
MSQRKRLVIGQGQISGYISIFLATMVLLGILCFRYPERLTTPEFREIYTKESVQALMAAGIIAAFFFALLSIILSKKFKLALIGACIAGLAILLGALTVQGRSVDKVRSKPSFTKNGAPT